MRHPFDGLNGGITRRGALGMAAGVVASLAGLGDTPEARAEKVRLWNGEGAESSNAQAPTTEPFGEEAGNVVSRAEPGLEDGGSMPQVGQFKGRRGGLTKGFNEGGGGNDLVHVLPNALELQGNALKNAWRDLGAKDASVGVQGCAVLYGAKDGVAFLKANLKPEALKEPEADRRSVARWIEDLDSSAFRVRDAAEKELEKAGASAVTAMQRVLSKPRSLEQRKRLERLIEQAVDNSPTARGKRGIEVLVALRTPEAIKVLESLSKGDAKEWLTEAAREALGRAGKPPQEQLPPPPEDYFLHQN